MRRFPLRHLRIRAGAVQALDARGFTSDCIVLPQSCCGKFTCFGMTRIVAGIPDPLELRPSGNIALCAPCLRSPLSLIRLTASLLCMKHYRNTLALSELIIPFAALQRCWPCRTAAPCSWRPAPAGGAAGCSARQPPQRHVGPYVAVPSDVDPTILEADNSEVEILSRFPAHHHEAHLEVTACDGWPCLSSFLPLLPQAIAKARAGGGFGSAVDPYEEDEEEESSTSSLDLEQVQAERCSSFASFSACATRARYTTQLCGYS